MPFRFRFRLLWALVLTALLGVTKGAGRKKVSRMISQRKTNCAMGKCLGLQEADPNCELKCISEDCFQEIYGSNELEPGEIDSKRNQQFMRCAKRELNERLKKEKKDKVRNKHQQQQQQQQHQKHDAL
mmetsp:Transcript_28405/g.49998  ORF Transcript_28405/g.49998 Transcript_28405/m.49998 type:complete len:128 (-) Transcript_28405:252-635(-)